MNGNLKGVSTAFWQTMRNGEKEMNKYVLLELSEEEAKEIDLRRQEFLTERSVLRKIPVSINEIDIDAWAEAFTIAAPHDEAIFSLFYFYEDNKAEMRCD